MELVDSWPWVTSRVLELSRDCQTTVPLKCRWMMRAKSISFNCLTFICYIYLFMHLGKVFWNIYMYIFLNMCMYICMFVDICTFIHAYTGFPGDDIGKESTCQCGRRRRLRIDPWVGKIPWKRKWQPTPVFLPRKSCGQKSLVGYHSWVWRE